MISLDDYIDSHISPEPEHLHRLYRHTHLSRLYPRMCTDHAQGRLLSMLTAMIRPAAVLELGTFTGYSTLCFAEGLAPGGRIDTVEIDADYADDLRELFAAEAPHKDIRLHIGDAEQIIATLPVEDYDMVFIDANKRRYPQYLDLLLPRLRPGAYIFADNTLWSEKILDSAKDDDAQTAGIRRFNDMVAADPRLEKIIIPIRDGLTIIRRL